MLHCSASDRDQPGIAISIALFCIMSFTRWALAGMLYKVLVFTSVQCGIQVCYNYEGQLPSSALHGTFTLTHH